MKALIGALIVALTAGSAVAQFVDYRPTQKPKVAEKVGITDKDFDAIRAGLEENASVLLEGQIPNRDALSGLAGVQYDLDTWKVVNKYLKSLNTLTLPKVKRGGKLVPVKVEECHRLYIICKLTAPLIVSKPEVIREALKTVRDLEGKHSTYMPMPKCSFLADCKYPDPFPKGGNATELMAKVDQARQKKSAKELPAILNNEMIGEFENTYCCMMAYAGDEKEDKNLADWILTNENKKNYIWRVGIEALNTEAASGDMSKARAKALYQTFLQAGKGKFLDRDKKQADVEWGYRWYYVYHMPEPNPDTDTPNMTVSWEHTGYIMLTTAKWLDMVVKGIKDPADKNAMVVHNPQKSDSDKWKPSQERKWKGDPEAWPTDNTKREKAPPGFKDPG